MTKLSSPLVHLLAMAGCALALGSCNRAEYAALPKTSTYYGEASHRRAVAAPAAEQPAVVVTSPAPAATPAAASAPVAAATPAAPKVAKSVAPMQAAVAAAPKPTLVQRMLAKKVMKKMDKMVAKMQRKDATASTARIDGNLRTAILFGLVGLILEILGGVAGIFYVIGSILIVIGLIFLVLWLLDNL